MNQHQIEDALHWLVENTACEWADCDESQHIYFNDHYIGGYAGDDRSFFFIPSPLQEKLLELYKVSEPEETELTLGLRGIIV